MNSFYGGQAGRTYHIVKRFKSIALMTTAFSKGGSYIEVNYGEYVLISTLNKNSDLNGLLFRRGFDYNDDNPKTKPNREDLLNGLKKYYYIETIEGTQILRFNEELFLQDLEEYFLHVGNGAIYVGRIVGAMGKSPDIGLLKWEDPLTGLARQDSYASLESDSDADGYEGRINNSPVYNDTILVATFSELDENGNVKEVKLALKIPKPTFIVSAQSVDAYGDTIRSHTDEASGLTDSYIEADPEQEQEEQNANLKINVNRDSLGNVIGYSNLIRLHSLTGKDIHPFYHNYDIAIPKGIKGDTYSNLLTKIAISNQLDNENTAKLDSLILGELDFVLDGQDKRKTFIPSALDNTNLDSLKNTIKFGDLYITFDLTNYDRTAEGDIIPNQGRLPFRVIEKITGNIRSNRYYIPPIPDDPDPINPKVGDLYKLSSTKYGICVKAGAFEPANMTLDKWNKGGYTNPISINETQRDASNWYWIEILHDTEKPYSLTIDYKAGPSDLIKYTGFLDYIYLDNEGNLQAKYADGTDVYLGFVKSIKRIDYDSDIFTVKYIDDTTQSFTLNSIVDLQRIGDLLYILFADDNFRKNYALNSENQGNWQYLQYSRINPNSRFITQLGDNPNSLSQEFIYIRLNSTIDGGYHISGMFDFIDLIWTKDKQTELLKYLGKIADADESILSNVLNNYDDNEKDEYWKQLKNLYKEGYIINIPFKRDVNGTLETVIKFYSFNYNHAHPSIMFEHTLDGNDLLNAGFIFNQQELTYQFINNNEVLVEIDLEKELVFTYWFPIQLISETSISLSRVYFIDDPIEDEEDILAGYKPAIHDGKSELNDNGLWLISTYGNDNIDDTVYSFIEEKRKRIKIEV